MAPETDRKVLELRKAGASTEHIARALEITEADATAALSRALGELRQESDEQLRRLEIERLDAMQRALWPKALQGSWLAIDRCLAIMERRAHLLSLDGARPVPAAHDALDELKSRRQQRLGRSAAS